MSLRELGTLPEVMMPGGEPKQYGSVGPRGVEMDMNYFRAIFNWWKKEVDDDGDPVLERNPIDVVTIPRSKNEFRPVISHAEYERCLACAGEVDWRLGALLCVLEGTGRRSDSVLHLRWEDISWDQGAHGAIRWVAEHDKQEIQWDDIPMAKSVQEALARHRRGMCERGLTSEWIFPASQDAGKTVGYRNMLSKFKQCCEVAGVTLEPGSGLHMFRRKFATESSLPDHLAMDLGGWSDPASHARYRRRNAKSLEEAVDLPRNRIRGPGDGDQEVIPPGLNPPIAEAG